MPADLDGDGTYELTLSSWNNLNLTNVDVTGPDTYDAPGSADPNALFQASFTDDVALFSCIAVNIDQNSDEEVHCPAYSSGNVALLNYETGEDASQMIDDNVVKGILPNFAPFGLVAGDTDKDGLTEIIASTGFGYSISAYENGEPTTWIRIADILPWKDIEDPSSYSIRGIPFPKDGGGFNKVYDASDNFLRYELPNSNTEFAAKLAFLGDADKDGEMEHAFSMQSVPDSLYVFEEIDTPNGTVREITPDSTKAYPNRSLLRIFSSGNDLHTGFTEDHVIVPQDYVLGADYPNPFNSTTTFSIFLPLQKRISVRVYNVGCRIVSTLID